MNKKYYTLLIASDANSINRSVRISRLLMHLMLIFFLLLFIFAYIGFSFQFNLNQNVSKTISLEQFKSNIVDLVDANLEFNSLPDSLLAKKIDKVINSRLNQILFSPPVDGFVTQSINKSNNHNGIDIAAERGERILASQAGLVIFSGFNGELGNTVILSHSYGYFTVYSHCDSLLVHERMKVKEGDIIGTVGQTGKASAPHLHFELWYNDSIIDPRKVINKYGDLDVSTE